MKECCKTEDGKRPSKIENMDFKNCLGSRINGYYCDFGGAGNNKNALTKT